MWVLLEVAPEKRFSMQILDMGVGMIFLLFKGPDGLS